MADMDMDLDDLDGPSRQPARAGRFAPKNSRFKPQPRPKPESEPSSSSALAAAPSASSSESTKKEEELDSKPPIAFVDSNKCEPSTANDAVKMELDVPAKGEGGDASEVEPMEVDAGGATEEEDEVVREIDVYFTPSVDPNTKMYVLQYPLRPLWRPYELDERCEEVRLNPTTAEVEIDLAVDVDSKNYDLDFRTKMTKQTLSCSWKPAQTTGYAIGVLRGNKLHLNPVHAVVQLRPSMLHLKASGSKRKNSTVEDTINLEGVKDEKSAGPSKKQNKQPGALNEQNQDFGESWIPLKFHGATSDIAATYVEKMVEEKGSPIHFAMSPYDYIDSLCPGTHKGLTRRFLLSLPLEERFETWFLKGPPVHRFSALKHLAPEDSNEAVLGVVQKYARLVQGIWVPRKSSVANEGADILARDLVLTLFRKNLIVKKGQLPLHQHLAGPLKKALSELAIARPSFNDWKFKEPPDISFIELHPDIVQKQEEIWDHIEEQIQLQIFKGKNQPRVKNVLQANIPNKPITLNTSDKGAATTSNGTGVPMSAETREALPKALQKVFQTHKVCSFEQLCKHLLDMAVSKSNLPKGGAREARAAVEGLKAPREEFMAILDQVAINVHGVFVLKSSPDHPQYDGLRKTVIDLLVAEGPKAKLKKASVYEAAKLQLKRDITNNEYIKVMTELCTSQGSAWTLKSSGN